MRYFVWIAATTVAGVLGLARVQTAPTVASSHQPHQTTDPIVRADWTTTLVDSQGGFARAEHFPGVSDGPSSTPPTSVSEECAADVAIAPPAHSGNSKTAGILCFAPQIDDIGPIAEESQSPRENAGPTLRFVHAPPEQQRTAASGKVTSEKVPGANSLQLGPSSSPLELPPLTDELLALKQKIRDVLATYEPRHLNTRDHSCWEVMHALIAFGVKTNVRRDGPTGEKANAIGWLAYGNRCRNMSLVSVQDNRLHLGIGPDVQGHPGQFLAMLAQSRVQSNYPIRVGGREFTLADLIEEEKLDCRSGTELTFKLIAMTHYLPSDTTWQSRNGEKWDIPRLVREEVAGPINTVACGGTHRLFGISSAYRIREARGEPLDGEYARAKKYITDYQKYTLTELQNPDGSLSTEWFKYANNRPDLDRKLQTTGHMLEWLAASLTDEQLRNQRTQKTVDFLAGILKDNSSKQWSIGPLGHALHALVIYDERVFQKAERQEATAEVAGRAWKPTPPVDFFVQHDFIGWTIYPMTRAVAWQAAQFSQGG